MIVRLLLWRLDGGATTFEELRERIDRLEPLPPPGLWLWSEPQERFGALVVTEDDEPAPPQLDEVRALLGRDPDLFDEFDALDL